MSVAACCRCLLEHQAIVVTFGKGDVDVAAAIHRDLNRDARFAGRYVYRNGGLGVSAGGRRRLHDEAIRFVDGDIDVAVSIHRDTCVGGQAADNSALRVAR